jgi:hypothetical protein
MSKRVTSELEIDHRSGKIPAWAVELIKTHLAIENEDAQHAGELGFMARALILATMPYKDPKAESFVRVNGDFRLRIVAGYEGGIPFGIYPRLLMSCVATEAVRKESPIIELGDSLRGFLRDILDLRSTGGGKRGSATRVTEQMKRLFGSLITAKYSGSQEQRGFLLKNVMIAEDLRLRPEDEDALDNLDTLDDATVNLHSAGQARAPDLLAPLGDSSSPTIGGLLSPAMPDALWTPQPEPLAGTWKSQVRLTDSFFRECVESPVPIDLRAYKALRDVPLAMDIYTWLSYRMSYTKRRTKPIPWPSLMMQFGSSFNMNDPEQAARNFKKQFLPALKMVLTIYPDAQVELADNGLVLLPSPPHVVPKPGPQRTLF